MVSRWVVEYSGTTVRQRGSKIEPLLPYSLSHTGFCLCACVYPYACLRSGDIVTASTLYSPSLCSAIRPSRLALSIGLAWQR